MVRQEPVRFLLEGHRQMQVRLPRLALGELSGLLLGLAGLNLPRARCLRLAVGLVYQPRGHRQDQHQHCRGCGEGLVPLHEPLQQLPGAVFVGAHPGAGLESLDLLGQLLGSGIPPGALPNQGFFRHGGQLRRHPGGTLEHRRHGLIGDLPQHLEHCAARVRRATREQLVEHGPQGPHVRLLVDGLQVAPGLLRAHVGRRAHGRAGHGMALGGRPIELDLALEVLLPQVLLPSDLGQPPVEHHGLAELAEHHVLGLDVPVDHAPTMGVGDGLAQIHIPRQQLEPLGQGVALIQRRRQGPPPHQLHGVVQGAVRALPQLVHRDDVRMLELAGDSRLSQEPRRGGRRHPPGRRIGPGPGDLLSAREQLLHRDLPPQVPIHDHQHPPDAPTPDLLVGASRRGRIAPVRFQGYRVGVNIWRRNARRGQGLVDGAVVRRRGQGLVAGTVVRRRSSLTRSSLTFESNTDYQRVQKWSQPIRLRLTPIRLRLTPIRLRLTHVNPIDGGVFIR